MSSDNEECLICSRSMTGSAELLCGHKFHPHCWNNQVKQYLDKEQSISCPCCRQICNKTEPTFFMPDLSWVFINDWLLAMVPEDDKCWHYIGPYPWNGCMIDYSHDELTVGETHFVRIHLSRLRDGPLALYKVKTLLGQYRPTLVAIGNKIFLPWNRTIFQPIMENKD